MRCHTFLFLLPVAILATNCQNKEEPAIATTPSAPAASYPQSSNIGSESTSTGQSAPTSAPNPTGVQKTYSGLQYEVLKAGTGEQPTKYNSVKVIYRGYFPDGREFDSSRGQAVTFSLTGGLIPGWKEGIPLMKEGAKYRFTIPPHLAYGAKGQPPRIPPNQTLKFDVELIDVTF